MGFFVFEISPSIVESFRPRQHNSTWQFATEWSRFMLAWTIVSTVFSVHTFATIWVISVYNWMRHVHKRQAHLVCNHLSAHVAMEDSVICIQYTTELQYDWRLRNALLSAEIYFCHLHSLVLCAHKCSHTNQMLFYGWMSMWRYNLDFHKSWVPPTTAITKNVTISSVINYHVLWFSQQYC